MNKKKNTRSDYMLSARNPLWTEKHRLIINKGMKKNTPY